MEEYIRYFTQEKTEPFVIEISGKSWCDGSYHICRENSRIWVMEYILSGQGEMDAGTSGRHYTPRTDDIYLLPAGIRHFYSSDAENPWEKIFLNLRGPVVDALAAAYGVADKFYFPQQPALKDAFLEIYGLMQDKALSDRYVIEQTELLVHKIFRGLGSPSARKETASDEIRTVRRYLDEHVGEIVTIQEMAALIYRSPDYLIKHFKAEVGVTPYQYLLKRKMMIAERLLRDTTLTVQEVAEQVGYDDAHYFSGLFKKEKKVPPSVFRKQVK